MLFCHVFAQMSYRGRIRMYAKGGINTRNPFKGSNQAQSKPKVKIGYILECRITETSYFQSMSSNQSPRPYKALMSSYHIFIIKFMYRDCSYYFTIGTNIIPIRINNQYVGVFIH